MRKILAVTLITLLTVSNAFTYAYATETKKSAEPTSTVDTPVKSNRVKTSSSPTPSSEPTKKPTETKKEMEQSGEKKNTTKDNSPENNNNEPEVLSESAILVNSNTGRVLFEKNAHKQMYPASTTKIMTAYLALKHLDLKQEITASKTALDIPSDSSKMGLVEGEILTVKNLLYVLMVQSANDAANVLAEAVSGSVSEFVQLMNDTAKELGMHNTNFANPHGYHDENHYTTAYDMSLIAQKAMENEVFAEIVSTYTFTLPPTNKHAEERKFSTRNYLINPRSSLAYRYTYATGIKTGFTSAAGQCLVGGATRSGMSLVSVVFKAPETTPERAFVDSKKMYEYAYSKYRIRTVQKGDELASTCNVKWALGKRHMVLKTNKDVKALLPRDDYIPELVTNEITIYEDIVAPIKEGTQLGEIRYYYDKELVISAPLYATRDVSRSYLKQFFSYIFSFWFLALFGIVVAIILYERIKVKKRIAKIRKIKKQNLKKMR